MVLTALSTPSFDRVIKRMHKNDKNVLDEVVKDIAKNPFIGEEKRGDLVGVFTHKFKLNNQETLLDYRLRPNKQKPTEFILLSVDSHENFCIQLKRAK